MITSVLGLAARPGREQALEDLYADLDVLARAERFPGCRRAQLLRTLDPDAATTHLVVAEWDDEAAYAGWVADPWRNQVGAQLGELLVEGGPPTAGHLHAVVPRPDRSA